MAQTSINIRMDEELKKSFEDVCQQLGLNMTTAITISRTSYSVILILVLLS